MNEKLAKRKKRALGIEQYPQADYVGIADGAKYNDERWSLRLFTFSGKCFCAQKLLLENQFS